MFLNMMDTTRYLYMVITPSLYREKWILTLNLSESTERSYFPHPSFSHLRKLPEYQRVEAEAAGSSMAEVTHCVDHLRGVRDQVRHQGYPTLHDGSVEESFGHGGHNL